MKDRIEHINQEDEMSGKDSGGLDGVEVHNIRLFSPHSRSLKVRERF